MGVYAAGDFPSLDSFIEESCSAIGREIEALAVPHLAGVVLGGGYGRGEGGVKIKAGGKLAMSNDLDFFAVTEKGADEGAVLPSIAAALEPVSAKWTAHLGVDVDFAVKTPWRLKHDEHRIMVQELVRGYFDVAGIAGKDLFSEIGRFAAEEIPWMEAARLLMNRGMGILMAHGRHEPESADFTARNINKCILGAGDARLVSRRLYAWKAEERARRLGDALYTRAVEWKFRPSPEPVCGLEKAKEIWFSAYAEVMEAGRRDRELSRSVRQAMRWLVRRRSFGPVSSFGRDCTVRVLESVAKHLSTWCSIDRALEADWKIFN